MTSPSNEEDQLAGIQSALILLFDGLEPTQIMDVLDGVLPRELSLWHASDVKSVRGLCDIIRSDIRSIQDGKKECLSTAEGKTYVAVLRHQIDIADTSRTDWRSEEHTSELQSH